MRVTLTECSGFRHASVAGILAATLMSSHVAAAQAKIRGAEAVVIAKQEAQKRGVYVEGMTTQWDEDNSSWIQWVGPENAATIAAQHSACGYWAILFARPPEVRPHGLGSRETLILTRGGSVYVLVDKYTGAILEIVPVR